METVEQAIRNIKAGKMVIIVDNEDRENEGDLAIAATHASPEVINFMVTHGRGLVCMPMLANRLEELHLPMMVHENTARLTTAFTISVDLLKGTTTGISAQDRSSTIKALIDSKTKAEDLARPGHIFPLRYTPGGVLVRAGHTEAIIDLSKLAGKYPAGVVCEILGGDGSSAKLPQLQTLSERYNIPIISVADIISYRQDNELLIERVAEARLPTKYGTFTAISYRSIVDRDEHVALVTGTVTRDVPTLVRVHSECLTGDVFGSTRCDCGDQAILALEKIAEEGNGIFLYMRQEGRGIGIHNKIKAYHLQDHGLDTVEANVHLGFAPDVRHYGVGAQILADLGVGKMRQLTNNPRKLVGLDSFGIQTVERVPIIAPENQENSRYLRTKKDRMGHILEDAMETPEDQQ